MRDDDNAVDLAPLEGMKELFVVPKRHAAERLPAWAEHIRMRQDTITAIHGVVADGIEADSLNAVEETVAQSEIVDIGRRRAAILDVDVMRVVEPLAQPGMRFHPVAV